MESYHSLSCNSAQISQANADWLRRLYNTEISGSLGIRLERRSNLIAKKNPWYNVIKPSK